MLRYFRCSFCFVKPIELWDACGSDLEDPRETGQIFAARFRYHDDIFQPHAADALVIEPRLYGHDLSRFQDVTSHADAGRLMEFKSEPMTGAVEIPLHAAVLNSCIKAKLCKSCLNRCVYFFRDDPAADHSEGNILPRFYGRVNLFQLRRRFAADYGAREVRIIKRFLATRENIHDDRLMSVKRSRALFVRVDCLMAAGDDRMFSGIAFFQKRSVDDPF